MPTLQVISNVSLVASTLFMATVAVIALVSALSRTPARRRAALDVLKVLLRKRQ